MEVLKSYKKKIIAAILAVVILVSSFPLNVYAVGADTLLNENEIAVVKNTQGIDDSRLRFSALEFVKKNKDGSIQLRETHWMTSSTGWGNYNQGNLAGRFVIEFLNKEFYEQIESIKYGNNIFESKENGKMWTLELTKGGFYGSAGFQYVREITIKLKGGKSLSDLGLSDKNLPFQSFWINSSNKINKSSIHSSYIPATTYTDTMDKMSKEGFMKQQNTRALLYLDDQRINSSEKPDVLKGNSLKLINFFKPDENFLQSDYNWVLYFNQTIPKEIIPFIDPDKVFIYASNYNGEFGTANTVAFSGKPVKLNFKVDENNVFSTKNTKALTILDELDLNTPDQLKGVRSSIDTNILYGSLGQSRAYTIHFGIKDQYNEIQAMQALNKLFIEGNNLLFESWIEADYLDSRDAGLPPKVIETSVANTYFMAQDSDNDGIIDIIESEIGTNAALNDTDKDGVDDGDEFFGLNGFDISNPLLVGSYMPGVPVTEEIDLKANEAEIIEGLAPKINSFVKNNKGELTEEKVETLSPEAGNQIVRLYKYDIEKTEYIGEPVAETRVKFEDLATGNFSLDVKGKLIAGNQYVLVSFSPDGKISKKGSIIDVETLASQYEPTYNGESVRPGQEVSVDSPIFNGDKTVEDVKNDLKADGAFALSDDYSPEMGTAVVDSETGAIIFTTKDYYDVIDLPKTVEIPVVVSYIDGTKDKVKVIIIIEKPYNEEYEPEVKPITKDHGEAVTEEDIKDAITVPGYPEDGVQPKIVISDDTVLPDGNTPGETTITVEVVYPDGTKDKVDVTIIVGEQADNDKYTPEVKPITKDHGEAVTEEDIKDAITVPGYPEDGAQPKIVISDDTVLPDGNTPGETTITVEVVYPDGTKDIVDVTIIVTKDAEPEPTPDKSTQPKVNPVKPGDREITGEGIPGATIIITNPDGTKTEVTVDKNGNWSAPIDTVRPGDRFEVVQKETGKDSSKPVIIRVEEADWFYPGYMDFIFGYDHIDTKVEVELESGKHVAYMKGYPNGTVQPEGNMTRAEAVTVLVRLENLNLGDSSNTVFADTDMNGWYNIYINAAQKAGWLEEKSGENFRPDEMITRAELAQLISHIDKENDATAPFDDVRGHKFQKAINQAYGNDRILGYPDGTFRPDQEITRAEVATMLNRFYDRKVDEMGVYHADHISNLVKFTDLDRSHWAYYEILEATNTHEYTRKEAIGLMENWDDILVDYVE